MRVLIHSPAVPAHADVRDRVVRSLEAGLGPVRADLRAVDVYLTDVNGPRGGPDKRCRVVAHLPTGRPLVVSRTARDPVVAAAAAAARARRSVRARLTRRRHRHRRSAAVR